MAAFGWRAVAWVTSALAAAGARELARGGWRAVRGEDPPRNPAAPSVSWRDALGWGLLMGVGVGLVRMLTRRGAAAAWEAAFDENPLDE